MNITIIMNTMLLLVDKDPVILKPRKSSVIEIFSDKSGIMEDFIKKEKIDLKDETDLVELVKHYDNI